MEFLGELWYNFIRGILGKGRILIMEKAIKVTAIVSAVIYTIATIFGSILMPMFLAVAYKYDWGDTGL